MKRHHHSRRRGHCYLAPLKMPGSNMWEMERRFSVADNDRGLPPPSVGMVPSTSEDLHAWSIYRQNLNSDFTDSALGSSEKSPLPYGNFQLRESTVQSILNHPRYGPKSPLGSNMYTYLKFGLPRVFPPNSRGKDTSSGYNSSDEGTRRRRASYMRARSEADLANLHYQPGISARGKSVSQANLLSPDTLLRQSQASQRRSLHDLRHTDFIPPNFMHQPPGLNRPASVAVPNRPPSVLTAPMHPNEPFSFSMLRPQQYTGLHPHLQITHMDLRGSNGEGLANIVSMEVKAGEILSIMSTNGAAATSFLDVISGNKSCRSHITLNGQTVTASDLRRSVAYVRSDTVLHPDMAVHNCLRFYAKLRRPHKSRGKIPMYEQVRIVTEELGLSPVLDTKVSELTRSEYSRLLVAIQLLADPQILCIDQITHTMDIFDTFFLVEFLRQWASGATGGVTGRIVIMALQPPTYEILTMVSRLLVISGGEVMYYGPARHITQYFTSADYPCPAFKNPADYYLDLVTLDDLSAEAMLESSQRVDQLAGLYRQRRTPMSEAQRHTLPTKFSSAGLFSQTVAIFMREVIYTQPSSFNKWITRMLLAALLSVIIGAIFWDVPTSDPHLNRQDRLGYHYTVLVTAALPLILLLSFSKTHGILRQAAESDIRQHLYNRMVYIIVTLILTVFPSALIWLAYLVPAYIMSGLYDQSTSDGLTVYLAYGLAHLLTLQYLTIFIGYLVQSNRGIASLFAIGVHSLMGASSGYPLHIGDITYPGSLLSLGTPLPWIYSKLLSREHSKDTLTSLNAHLVCRNKQVQHQDIIVQLPCPIPNGTSALEQHGLSLVDTHHDIAPYINLLTIVGASCLLSIFVFSLSPLFRRK